MKLTSIFSCFLILSSCTGQKQIGPAARITTPSKSSIFGGREVGAADTISRSVVGLYNKKMNFICTGSLIAEDLVLTAAHCIEGAPSDLQIVFGLDFSALDSNNLKRLRSSRAVRVHPQFKKDENVQLDRNDLALIQFSGGLPEGYAHVEFLHEADILKPGAAVQLVGFGATGVDLQEVDFKNDRKFRQALDAGEIVCTDALHTLCHRVIFLGNDALRTTEIKIEGFTEKEIRTNETKGQGTCVGDSGGPMLVTTADGLRLIGVTSRGSELCDGPAVYTNALEYLDWIEQATTQLRN